MTHRRPTNSWMVWESASSTLAYAAKFAALFGALAGALEAARGTGFERTLVEDCILRPTVALIHAVAPGEHVTLVGRTFDSPSTKLNITRGCEGTEMFLLLTAGVLAFPTDWARRAKGIAFGLVLVYALSVSRLVALQFTLAHTPNAWETLHGLVLPLAPVAIVVAYFLHWTASASPAREALCVPDAP